MGHFVAGVSHWEYGNFRAYHVNPPLVRLAATILASLTNLDIDWSIFSSRPRARPEFPIGTTFVHKQGFEAVKQFAISCCHLVGEPGPSFWGRKHRKYANDPSRSYFNEFEPVGRIGYSMKLFHVTTDDANRLRKKYGLPILDVADDESKHGVAHPLNEQ